MIETIGTTSCLVDAAEEVADEARNFQKCLIQMFASRGQEVAFVETHMAAGMGRPRPSMAIECIPLDTRDAAAAPGYFKKAILECDEEWSQHKKLYDTRGCIRGTVPPGFSYFAVGFGIQAGYAHAIEDEAGWNRDFGRNVLEGLLEHEDAGIPLKRRRKDDFDKIKQRVVSFAKAFEPFDWTRNL